MKKLLVSVIFCSAGFVAVAQRAKVTSADDALAKKDYEKAKADIQAALEHEKTKNDAKTWYVKGKILEAEATEKKNSGEALEAFEAYKKALEIDPKMKEALLEMNQRMFNLYATVGNAGYGSLNDQKWDSAFVHFRNAFSIADFYNGKNLGGTIPTDTSMTFYTGYAANQAGKKDEALTYLQKAAQLQFKSEPALYVILAQTYEEKGDNANWIKTIEEAKAIFPKDKRFNDMEMIYYSKTGKSSELLTMLEKKMQENPNDFNTVLDYGIRVDNLANPRADGKEEATKPANYDELMNKAEAAYKKAIELKADDATANFQLGALYFNRAVGFNKDLNNMNSKEQSSAKAKELQAKVTALMDQALPFFEKADENFTAKLASLETSDKQTYESCLYALQKIYAIKNETAKVEVVKKKLDGLK
jgi:tetratricopeptide (TPR) repeat protein